MGARETVTLRVRKEDIKAGLTRLGLKKGDTVGVHSSLSSFGYVDGGADAVIDALLETVGPRGNVVMSTHSANLSDDQRTPEMIALGVSWLFRILPMTRKIPPLLQASFLRPSGRGKALSAGCIQACLSPRPVQTRRRCPKAGINCSSSMDTSCSSALA
jgi:hypothetical protein